MCTSSRTPTVFAIAAGLVACSGEPPTHGREPTYVLIDDMEGESGRIRWVAETSASDALPGRWVSYADIQCENLSPVPEWSDAEAAGWTYAPLPERRETFVGTVSEHAARLRTLAPLDNTWGAGMGFQFSEPPLGTDETRVTRPCSAGQLRDLDYPAAPVDLSDYSGLAFFGMADEGAESATVLVQFQDANTDPRGRVCNPVPGSADECYNGFGVVLEFDETPTRYEIDFSELEQNPLWGYHPEPSIVDLERVYGLVFQVDTPGGVCQEPNICLGGKPQLTFDVWIDDLYFVKR